MIRRQALRSAVLTAFALALGKYDALAQGSGKKGDPTGVLTVDLNQWAAIVFKHQGQTTVVPMAEVFAAIQPLKEKV